MIRCSLFRLHSIKELYPDLDRAGIARNTPSQGMVDFHSFRITYTALVVKLGLTSKRLRLSTTQHTRPDNEHIRKSKENGRLQDVAEVIWDVVFLGPPSQISAK